MKHSFSVPTPPSSFWNSLNKYPELEREIMSEVLVTGYSHASVLRITFLVNRFRLNDALRNLWREGFIHRDVKGLVVSTYHTARIPHFKNWIQDQFKVTLT